jgi:hypothetical protein
VQLGRRGFAVGLASNGGVPVVPLGRGRLPALLEALARMPRRACAPLEQVLAGASCLRRGSSCVAFLYEADGRADGLGGLCSRFGVPAVGFACHPPREPQGAHRPTRFPFRLLSELADPERRT